MEAYLSKTNGVRQGSILSPILFAFYTSELSGAISLCNASYLAIYQISINDQCINHLCYDANCNYDAKLS